MKLGKSCWCDHFILCTASHTDYFIHILATTVFRTTESGFNTQEWTHRSFDFKFPQQRNIGNKTWQTGVFKRKLEVVAKGKNKEMRGHTASINRAKYILSKRSTNPNIGPVKPAAGFFKFEEELTLHIREALVICSTGVSASFFSNPYVRDLLQSLQPRHRTLYHKKMIRIIRCVMDCQQNEVSNNTYFVLYSIILCPS